MPSPETGVVAVAGECVVDLVAAGADGAYRPLPGGSPANVAVGLARLGVPARMIARISGDPFGRLLSAHLAANGVDTGGVIGAAEPTSVAFVHPGSDDFDLRIDGTADWQWTAGETAGLLGDDLAALHVGSLAMVIPPGADVLADLARRARATMTVSYDPNCRPAVMARVPDARARIEALMRSADIVKTSDADLEWLRPGAAPERFAADLLSAGVSVVAVTRGAAGSLIAGPRCSPRHVPAYRTAVADTVGAGDSYMSAVLASLHRRGLLGAAHRDALRSATPAALAETFDEASRAAAFTCGRHGADPPTRAELGAFRPPEA